MAIKRMDEVLAAIAAGKTNEEIRDQIDGRIGDKAINQLRKHPANADVPWPEDALKYEAEQAAKTEQTVAPQTETVQEETVASGGDRAGSLSQASPDSSLPELASGDGEAEEPKRGRAKAGKATPEWSRVTESLIEEIDPPMTMAEAIRELVRYTVTDDVDHLIEAALAINARMETLKRRMK